MILIKNQSHVVGRGEPSAVIFFRKKFWEFLILKNSFGSYVGDLGAQGLSGSHPGVIWCHIGSVGGGSS